MPGLSSSLISQPVGRESEDDVGEGGREVDKPSIAHLNSTTTRVTPMLALWQPATDFELK